MRIGGIASAALCAALMSAACGGHVAGARPPLPEPPPAGPRGAPAGTAAGPTGIASTAPPVDVGGDAAVLAAVRGYAASIDAAGRAGDLAPLAAAMAPTCPCYVQTATVLQQLVRNHWRLDLDMHADRPRILRRSAVNADVSTALVNGPYHVLDARGRILQDAPAASVPVVLSLELQGDRWIVFAAH